MPDVRIDQSPDIQSVRLRIPTGTVPIPPAGYAQLHSPSPGTLALRLPDGSVVPIGGGGGGTPGVLSGTGGVVEAISNPFTGAGVTISPAGGETIFLNGPVVGPDPDVPFGVQVARVPISSAELLALHTTPKVLVAEPVDPFLMVAPVQLFTAYLPGTTPYTNAAGGAGQLKIRQDAGNSWTTFFLDDVVAGGDLTRRWASGNPTGETYMGTVNRGLEAFATAPLVGGDGTLLLTVAYLVV